MKPVRFFLSLLEPKRDKVFIQSMGDESALAQALLVNNIDATYLSYSLANDLKKDVSAVIGQAPFWLLQDSLNR